MKRLMPVVLLLAAPFLLSAADLPVNVGSGDLRHVVPLFRIAQEPLSLDFTLTYHSQAPERPTMLTWPLGQGWTHAFNQTLVPTDATNAVLYYVSPEGYEAEFWLTDTTGAKLWTAVRPASRRGTVSILTDAKRCPAPSSQCYALTDLEGTRTLFDYDGPTASRWRRTEDRWGNSVTGSYTGADLTTITDMMGRTISLGYDTNHRLSGITVGPHSWLFDCTGNALNRIADPFHTLVTPWRSFTYGSTTLDVTDDAGVLLLHADYDASTGSVLTTYAAGNRNRHAITYGNLAGTPPTRVTTVTRTRATGDDLVTEYTVVYQGGQWVATRIEGGCTSCGGGGGADKAVYTYDPTNNRPATKVVGLNPGPTGANETVETDFTYDANGMLLTMTEAKGKAEERLTTYTYTQTGPDPPAWPAFATTVTEVSVKSTGSKTTVRAWNSDETLLTTTVTGDLSPNAESSTSYVTTAAYDDAHRLTSLAGPRPDQLIQYAHHSTGDSNRLGRLATQTVTTTSSPLASLVTTYSAYDLYGTATSVTDPNSVETQRTTDSRGRVVTITEKKPAGDPNEPPDYTSTYTYDTRDRLAQVQRPRGGKTRYLYEEGTNRLTDTILVDAGGNQQERFHLTLNLLGGRTMEEAQTCAEPSPSCVTWSTARYDTFGYDGRNRLWTVTHPDATFVRYTYDSRGNLWKDQDERHTAPNTIHAYDPLDRLTSVTQTLGGGSVVTNYGYDRRDDLTSVTDPNTNLTTYTFDDWARRASQSSPVSGGSSFSYDEAGNLASSSDANGATTARLYDLANRITSAISSKPGASSETVTWQYDDSTAATYRRGRLWRMADPTGSVEYAYDRRGLVRQEARMLFGTSYAQGYAYDSDGNRWQVSYPSGRVVEFGFDFAGRPISAQATKPSEESYVTSATYYPFGPRQALSLGNGTVQTRTYDTRYLLTGNSYRRFPNPRWYFDQAIDPDDAGNVLTVAESYAGFGDRTFSYDDLSRLKGADAPYQWGVDVTNGYTYDAMGNILSLRLGSTRTATFAHSGNTPLLTTVTENGTPTTVTYDPAGNVQNAGSTVYVTSARGYVGSVDSYGYAYDGAGLRRRRILGGTQEARYYFYTPDLHLLSESALASGSPTLAEDYVWLGDTPVAHVTLANGSTEWFATDSLGTPILGTDASGEETFRLELEPYGRVWWISENKSKLDRRILRYPGQEQEDDTAPLRERHYNIFRWYLPAWGRYSQPDPIGLKGGLNRFSYAAGHPTNAVDRFGLVCDVNWWSTEVGGSWQTSPVDHRFLTWPGGGLGFQPIGGGGGIGLWRGFFTSVPGHASIDVPNSAFDTKHETYWADATKCPDCREVHKCLQEFANKFTQQERRWCVLGENCHTVVDNALATCGLSRNRPWSAGFANCATVNGQWICAPTGI